MFTPGVTIVGHRSLVYEVLLWLGRILRTQNTIQLKKARKAEMDAHKFLRTAETDEHKFLGLDDAEIAFLKELEEVFAQAIRAGGSRKAVALRFEVTYRHKELAGLEEGDRIHFRRSPVGKGFIAEVAPEAMMEHYTPAAAYGADPCCMWCPSEDGDLECCGYCD
jgi:hypothetical protein